MKMKQVVMVIFALGVCSLSGCGFIAAGHLMDKASENMIKVMEAQARIEKEKRAESYTIEGRFKTLEMKTEEIEEIDASKFESDKSGKDAKPARKKKTITTCNITFEDGRQKSFRTVPPQEMEQGKRYRINYNGMNEITGVSELPAK